MSLELQDRLERLDPKHASLWKRVFAAPAVCIFHCLETVREEKFHEVGHTVYYWRCIAIDPNANGPHSMQPGKDWWSCVVEALPYSSNRLITAFYIPIDISLRRLDLVLNDRLVATWTPDKSDTPLALDTLLERCRRLPNTQHYSPLPYRPSGNIEMAGRTYRRVVLLYPGIGCCWASARLYFVLEKPEHFEFFQEELVPPTPLPSMNWSLDGDPDAFRCFSPFPAAEVSQPMRALLARSETPKQLLASPQWAVPALSTASPSLSLTTSSLRRS